jgi:putative FmdB family regulatory protein
MLYVFQCEKCLKQYEVMMKLEEHGQKVKCPQCKKAMKQKLTPLRFKIN